MISRVFDGGAGEIKPGTEERSRESGDFDRFFERLEGEDVAENGGELVRWVVWRGGSCVATDMSSASLLSFVFCKSSVLAF